MKKLRCNYGVIGLLLCAFLFACTPDEDDDPDVDPREKFTGTWQCRETSKVFGLSNYQVKIALDPGNSTQVHLTNFYQFGWTDKANAVAAGNTIQIPTQPFCDHVISGRGIIDTKGLSITWDYVVDNPGAETDTCRAEFTKM